MHDARRTTHDAGVKWLVGSSPVFQKAQKRGRSERSVAVHHRPDASRLIPPLSAAVDGSSPPPPPPVSSPRRTGGPLFLSSPCRPGGPSTSSTPIALVCSCPRDVQPQSQGCGMPGCLFLAMHQPQSCRPPPMLPPTCPTCLDPVWFLAFSRFFRSSSSSTVSFFPSFSPMG